MSLTGALEEPTSLLRRIIDLSFPAGTEQLRRDYRAQLAGLDPAVPFPGVRSIAGVVGQAVDMRLRLALSTAPSVPFPVRTGIALIDTIAARDTTPAHCSAGSAETAPIWAALARVGRELVDQLAATVTELDLDDRATTIHRCPSDESRLARLLVAAAWYEIAYRTLPGFLRSPPARHADPDLTLDALLALVPAEAVDDLVALTAAADDGPWSRSRAATRPADCHTGPGFAGSPDVGHADADVIAEGTLIDIKTYANPREFPGAAVRQLLGYLLLDYDDSYEIRSVGVYQARGPALVTWPIPDFLNKLGATADLTTLRSRVRDLGRRAPLDVPMSIPRDRDITALLLADAGVRVGSGCWICGEALPRRRPGGQRRYCCDGCRGRSAAARRALPLPRDRAPVRLLSPP